MSLHARFLQLMLVVSFLAACAAATPDGGPPRIGLALPRGLDPALDWRIVAEGPSGQELVEVFDPVAPSVRLDALEAGVWTIKADGVDTAAGTLARQGVAAVTIMPGATAVAELTPTEPVPFRVSGSFSGGTTGITNASVAALYLMSGTEIVETNLAESYPPGFRTGADPEMAGTFGGAWQFDLPRLPDDRDWWVLALVSGDGYAEAMFLSTKPIQAGYRDATGVELVAGVNAEHWVRVNFNTNGGDSANQIQYRRPGDTVTLPTAAAFTRSGGYYLAGWNTDYAAAWNDPSNLAPGAPLSAGNANATYYAIWQPL